MLIPPFLALLQEHAEGSPAFVHRLLAVLTLFFQETEAQRSRRLCLRSRGVSVCLEAECRNTTVQVAQMTSADAPSSARWTPRSGCWWLGVWCGPPLVHRHRPLALSSRLFSVSSWGLGALLSLLPPRPLSPSRGSHPGPCLTPISPEAVPPTLGSARSSEKRWAVLVVWFLVGSGAPCASHRVGGPPHHLLHREHHHDTVSGGTTPRANRWQGSAA